MWIAEGIKRKAKHSGRRFCGNRHATITCVFPYGPTLLAAAPAVPQSIADVLHTMQTIDATCIDGDGLKWFNWLYLQVTQATAERIAAGGFADPAWLAQLDVQFARLYFSALRD